MLGALVEGTDVAAYPLTMPMRAHREATPLTANAERLGPVAVSARRTHLAEAIVSQWLLEQLPADHRHARRSASDLRRERPL